MAILGEGNTANGGIWNYSSVQLSQHHISVLQRSLTFCPTPLQWPPNDYQKDLVEFQRKVRNHVRFRIPEEALIPGNALAIPNGPGTVQRNSALQRLSKKRPSPVDYQQPGAENVVGCSPHPPRDFYVRSGKAVPWLKDWEQGEMWLLDFCQFLDAEIGSRTPQPNNMQRDNLTHLERRAMNELARNTSIVMKKPDKSQGIVICDRQDYIEFGLRQLSKQEYYQPILGSLAPHKARRLSQIVKEVMEVGDVRKPVGAWLTEGCTNFKERKVYFLMKVHKPQSAWWQSSSGRLLPPGRPIISNVQTELSNAAKFVDFWLLPSQLELGALVRDSYDFIERLHNLPLLKESRLVLVTADVKDLYTNISQQKAADCVIKWLQQTPEQGRPSVRFMAELLELQLFDNDFTFNGQWYKQIKGIAMGWNPAPTVANYYLKQLDDAILKHQPIAYYRFIDDIFMIWDGDRPREELEAMQQNCTLFDSNIELVWTEPSQRATFLDVEVFIELPEPLGLKKRQRNTKTTINNIGHRVYFKPTDTHALLHRTSCHPVHTFRGLIKSQLLRYRRLCSDDAHAHLASNILFKVLLKRHYDQQTLYSIRTEVWKKPQLELFKKNTLPKYLPGTAFLDKADPTEEIMPLCIPYSPETANMASLIHNQWSSYVEEFPNHAPYWPKKVTIAWRKNATLSNRFVRAQLPRERQPVQNQQ